jgi:hypothetical protein
MKITLMAIVQISKIQQRAGNLVDLPQLDEAEFGWASDQKRLFIGKTTPNENIEVLTSYSAIAFSQIDGAIGNLNISAVANGQVLAYDGSDWINKGGAAGGLITLGDAGNVKLTGGASGYVLQTDGTGNLSWTPKAVIVGDVLNVTKANPAVVTTAQNNFFPNGASVTFTNAQGMTELNGNTYTITLVSSNSFSLGVNSSAYNAYAFTNVTGTTVSTDRITVGNSAQFTANSAVKFTGNLSTSGITANTTYYVLGAPPTGTTIKIATSADSNASNVVVLQTTTGLTANVYQEGGRAISEVNGGSGFGIANGATTQVQYNNAGLLAGDSGFTYVSATSLLTVNGNANVGNLVSSGTVSGTRVISNIATGTTPIQVVSTTRVPNLNVSYANVSDFGAVTTQTTGTFYPIMVSANTSANYALASNANISFNAATGLLTTTTLAVTGNANVGNLGTAGLIVATGNVTGGNLVTAGALSVTGNANVGNLGTTGNITAANVTANLYGNGAAISAIAGANVTGEVDFAAVANSVALANVSGIGNIASVDLDGNVSNVLRGDGTFAVPAILYSNSNVATFLASFGSNTISTTGNANVGNLGTTGLIVATGNITGGNLVTAGQVVATGNVTGGNISTGGALAVTGIANVTGNINAAANINVTENIVVVGNINVTSNVTANNISTGSNVAVGLNLSVSGNSAVSGNATVTGNIIATGNVSANNLTLTSTANIGANINVTGNSRVTGNSNVTGNLTVTGTSSIAGNLSAGNITTAGNLAASNANLGNAATANYFVGDGSLLTNVVIPIPTRIVNGTSNVIVDGSSAVRIGVAGTSNVIVVQGTGATVTGTLAATGNVSIANLTVTGGIVSSSNISGSNILGSASLFIVGNALINGNAQCGNLGVGGNINATQFNGNVAGGNVAVSGNIIGGAITANGNVAAGNVVVTNTVTATTASATNGAFTNATIVNLTSTSIQCSGNAVFSSTQQTRDIIEQVSINASAPSSTTNINLYGAATNYYTVASSVNWTFNFRGNSSVSANSYLSTGQSVTTTALVTQGSTAYYPTAFTIDGTSVTPKWLAGEAPAAGDPNSVDAYTFTIVKTASATYTVFASSSKYA